MALVLGLCPVRVLALQSQGSRALPADAQAQDSQDAELNSIRIFAQALQIIRQDYLDKDKTDFSLLLQEALKGVLSGLDPHSQFLDKEAYKKMQEDTRSEFAGVGLQIGMREGALTVIAPIEGSPAFAAGILPGDRILRIDQRSTERIGLSEAVNLLRGPEGKPVEITLERPAEGRIFSLRIERAIIKVKSVRDAQLLPAEMTGAQRVGYVRVTQFSEPTVEELRQAVGRLEIQGAQALILDLRNNPGGLLSRAIEACGVFLPAGVEVVSSQGRSAVHSYKTPGPERPPTRLPLVILVNSASASAAEIVAGALKDLGRAVLVGETTFGKGSIQSISPLPDGSALRLTTAHYLTPGRQVIHEHGVEPHIHAPLDAQKQQELLRLRQEAEAAPAEKQREILAQDPQVQRAAEIARGLLIAMNREAKRPSAAAER